ncbi:MAG: cellulose biosynthesis protein BcsS [Alphaproteobacteria bacterium]|nr:cellulose biosynthesis protein BcsS [Alphaproteobacteria bacterium]
MSKKLLSALAVAVCLMAGIQSAEAGRTGAWTGVDFAPNSYYAYLGVVTALQNQDITARDGWLLRASAGYGEFDYNTVLVAGGVDGAVTSGDLMVGYGHFFDKGSIKGYLGGDYQHYHLSPNDPGTKVHGSQGGVKGLLEMNVNAADKIALGAMGSYSTAYDSYWTRFDASYNFGPFAIGPEALLMGNKSYDQSRFGGAISGVHIGFATARLYGGVANTRGRGADGGYGGISFGADF